MKRFLSLLTLSTLTMGVSAQCIADFTADTSNDPIVTFTNSSTPNSPSASYWWEFGDGHVTGLENPTHTYTANGTYDVCLIYIDAQYGCTDTVCHTITITNGTSSNCNVSFSSSNNDPTFDFAAVGNGTPPYYYLWNFGDGSVGANGSTANHTYTSNGLYTVCVTLTDGTGCNSSYCSTVTVNNVVGGNNCQAMFYHSIDSLNPQTVWIQDMSQGSNLSYSWDFGDGNTSNQQYPSHTYANFGSYLVCLTVTDGQCTSTFCDTVAAYQRSSGFTINVIPAGTLGLEESHLDVVNNVYPNPVTNEANLTLAASEAMNVDVMVYDVTGQVLSKTQQHLIQGTNQLIIPTNNLESGAYLINVLDQTGTSAMVTVPFIKR